MQYFKVPQGDAALRKIKSGKEENTGDSDLRNSRNKPYCINDHRKDSL